MLFYLFFIFSFYYFSYYILGDFLNLDIVDDKYILFINNYLFDEYDEKELSVFLKDVFIILSDVYSINLYGYFMVDIFIDENIGIYVEICKIDNYVSYSKKIDTKVNLVLDNFYLKTKDLSKIINYRPIYFLDNFYFISTKDVDNVLDIIEECEIVYKDSFDFINNIVKE